MAYQPFNYNPMYPNAFGQQNYVQPQYQQTNYQPQSSVLFNEVKYANENEVNSFCPNPNQRVLLFDTDNNIFRIKYADSFGKTTTETYKFEKVDNNTTNVKTLEFDPKDFATKEDLNGFIKEEKLNSKLDEFNKTITKQIDELTKQIKIKEILAGGNKDEKQSI